MVAQRGHELLVVTEVFDDARVARADQQASGAAAGAALTGSELQLQQVG